MLLSLALIFLVGLSLSSICAQIKLPRIIGMMITGIILGPYLLDLLAPSLLAISTELRQMALIIILIKAGLSINLKDLKEVGRPAFFMSFLPAGSEIIAYVLFAPYLLHITTVDAAVMGSVLAAASPAVIVPRMVELVEKKYGTNKNIPQFIMAGTSFDNVFSVLMFSTFILMAEGHHLQITDLLHIPTSIFMGILVGALTGYALSYFFERNYTHKHYIRNSLKVIIILGISFFLMALEPIIKPFVPLSGILAIVVMSIIIKLKNISFVSHRLSEKFGKLWLATELILFVLVGTAVDINYTLHAGINTVLIILIALLFRSIGVYLSVMGTSLSLHERLFCIISYLPKATVQAAIGSVPLGLGLPSGQIILSVAIVAILITAPLGDLGIQASYQHLLQKEKDL